MEARTFPHECNDRAAQLTTVPSSPVSSCLARGSTGLGSHVHVQLTSDHATTATSRNQSHVPLPPLLETCPCCLAQVYTIAPSEVFPSSPADKFSFCACCRRLQMEKSFSKKERSKGPARCCADCAGRERVENSTNPATALPERDTARNQAIAHTVKKLKQQYKWSRRLASHALEAAAEKTTTITPPAAVAVADPRIVQLKHARELWTERKLLHLEMVRLAVEHGDNTIEYSCLLYEELLVLDDQEFALREKEVALYTELAPPVADSGVPKEKEDESKPEPKTSAAHTQELLPTVDTQDTPTMICDVCGAIMRLPPVPTEAAKVKAGVCTCCCRVLPQTSFAVSQLDVSCAFPRCASCVDATSDVGEARLHANWPHHEEIPSLFNMLGKMRKQCKPTGDRSAIDGRAKPLTFDELMDVEASNVPAHAQVMQWKERLNELNARKRALVNGHVDSFGVGSGDRLQLSRALFQEHVEIEAGLLETLPLLLKQVEEVFRIYDIALPIGWSKKSRWLKRTARSRSGSGNDIIRANKKARMSFSY